MLNVFRLKISLTMCLFMLKESHAAKKGIKASGLNLVCKLSNSLKDTTNYVEQAVSDAMTIIAAAAETKAQLTLAALKSPKPLHPKTKFVIAHTRRQIQTAIKQIKENAPGAIKKAGTAALAAGRIDEFGELLFAARGSNSAQFCVTQDDGNTLATASHLNECFVDGAWRTTLGTKDIKTAQNAEANIPKAADWTTTAHRATNDGCRLLSSDNTDGFGHSAAAARPIPAMGGLLSIPTSDTTTSVFTNMNGGLPSGTPIKEYSDIPQQKLNNLRGGALDKLAAINKLGTSDEPNIPEIKIQKKELGDAASDGTYDVTTDELNTISKQLKSFVENNPETITAELKKLEIILIEQALKGQKPAAECGNASNNAQKQEECKQHKDNKTTCENTGKWKWDGIEAEGTCEAHPEEKQNQGTEGVKEKQQINAKGNWINIANLRIENGKEKNTRIPVLL
uniref:Variant surface glycoprotein 1238 n=1 Tax=Trypanosoma brucei TaxID=5691 RepID=M4SVW3_9TRYP|nr:variant surface glycoprotein 1238 [Trypanosoma brucei]